MNINKKYISTKNTTSGKTNAKKYIVIHETDNFNKGANGLAHAKAQYNGNLQTSVHFYCGSDGIFQTADLDKCVWAVGKTYLTKRPIMDADNYNTINIEICVNPDGDYKVARQNAIELTKYLMKELGLGADRVIRHYDAKGKHCPRKMMDDNSLWVAFKDALKGEVTKEQGGTDVPFFIKVANVEKGDVLNIREQPNADAKKTGQLAYNDPNTYTIVKVENGWGLLKSKLGWINLHYTNKVKEVVTEKQQTQYYPKYTGSSQGIDTVFRAIGVPEKFCGNYKNRKTIAKVNGLGDNYTGTATQNYKLISLAKNGMLKKP